MWYLEWKRASLSLWSLNLSTVKSLNFSVLLNFREKNDNCSFQGPMQSPSFLFHPLFCWLFLFFNRSKLMSFVLLLHDSNVACWNGNSSSRSMHISRSPYVAHLRRYPSARTSPHSHAHWIYNCPWRNENKSKNWQSKRHARCGRWLGWQPLQVLTRWGQRSFVGSHGGGLVGKVWSWSGRATHVDIACVHTREATRGNLSISG